GRALRAPRRRGLRPGAGGGGAARGPRGCRLWQRRRGVAGDRAQQAAGVAVRLACAGGVARSPVRGAALARSALVSALYSTEPTTPGVAVLVRLGRIDPPN